MTPGELADRLAAYHRFGVKLGLDNIRALCAALGHPERRAPAIHIAGTNGKGTTAACLDGILHAASYRVGRYTSPHLCDVTERITVDGIPVTHAALWRTLDHVERALAHAAGEGGEPLNATYFEVLTAAAYRIFATRMVDAAIYEVGLGGRLDATNIVAPCVTCITTIAFDHTQYLGATLEIIASEKAGIIKPGIPVVCGDLAPQALRVVDEAARAGESPVRRYGRDFGIREASRIRTRTGQRAVWWDRSGAEVDFELPLRGAWQLHNAACALAMAQVLAEAGWKITPKAMVDGLSRVEWRGRMEWLSRDPAVLYDCAHNPTGMAAACEAVREECPDGVLPVLAVLADKDADGMCRALASLGPRVIVTASANERAMPADELSRIAAAHFPNVRTADTLANAMRLAMDLAGPLPMFVVGSLMNYAEVVAALRERAGARL